MREIIRLDDIRRDFIVGDETVHALRGVSFTINEGEFVTIMGSSGSGSVDSLFVKTDYRLLRIGLDDILYVEGLKDYVRIWLQGCSEPVLTLMSMKVLEEQLPADRFIRVHRSYIIQPSKMSYIERGRVVFGKVRIPVSDTYRQGLHDFLGRHSVFL